MYLVVGIRQCGKLGAYHSFDSSNAAPSHCVPHPIAATAGSGGVPSESMTDKDNKGGGGVFDPKDLAFKMPTQSKDEIFSDKPPKSWPELVGKSILLLQRTCLA